MISTPAHLTTQVRPRHEGGGLFAPAAVPQARLWRDGGGSGANRDASRPGREEACRGACHG
jgi:hypothetical protein